MNDAFDVRAFAVKEQKMQHAMEAEDGYGGTCVLPSLLNPAFRVPSLRGVAEMGENEVDENEVDEAGGEEEAVDTKGGTAKNDDDERPNDANDANGAASCLCGMGHSVPCLVHGPKERLKSAVAQNSVDGSPGKWFIVL